MPLQEWRSRANRPGVSRGWRPGEEKWGSYIRTNYKGCGGRKRCRSPAAHGGGFHQTCGQRKGRIRMKRTRLSWSFPRFASRTEAERLGMSRADRYSHPFCPRRRHHCRCQSGKRECHPACRQQSKRKSSVAKRIQRADQTPQHSLQPGGVHMNFQPGRHTPVGPPCCCEHRQGTPTGPGCKADFPYSPH